MGNILDFIQIPIGYVLKFCSSIVSNKYIFAILIFAVLVELVMIPFGIKQQKNSIKQAHMRPKEMAIRKKYAGRDDQVTKQKMQEEIQELYQKEGYNPMGGCLPMLIQLPVLLILYNIVIDPLKYICGLSSEAVAQVVEIIKVRMPNLSAEDIKRLSDNNTLDIMSYIQKIGLDAFSGVSGFAEKIQSIEDLPDLIYWGINLGDAPSLKSFTSGDWKQMILLLVPVLTFVVYFFSSKLTRKLTYQPTTADDPQMGCSNKMMDIVMPLFSVYITFMTPAAIGIYWIFKSILGVLKQFILKKAMPLPTFTDDDYKAAEKEVNARVDKAPNVVKSGKIVRSLHHIDDEDFEDTREEALKRKAALEAQEAEEAKARAEAPKLSSLFGGAMKKKDDKKDSKKDKKESDNADKKSGDENNDIKH